MKVKIKEKAEKEEEFPCIRKGTATGELYLFKTKSSLGYALFDVYSVSFCNTEPWSGEVTITQ